MPLAETLEGTYEGAIGLLRELDDVVGPLDLREGEDQPPGPSVHDAEALAFAHVPFGFIAKGRRTLVDVHKDWRRDGQGFDGVVVSIFTWPIAEHVPRMLAELIRWCDAWKVRCASARTLAEEVHHLGVHIPTPQGNAALSLGENHRLFVPGLFWWNYWSLDWLRGRVGHLEQIPPAWEVAVDRDGPHPRVVVQGRFPWTEWWAYAAEAAVWADATPGVFSVREVLMLLPEGLDLDSVSRRLQPWR